MPFLAHGEAQMDKGLLQLPFQVEHEVVVTQSLRLVRIPERTERGLQ